MTNIKLTYDDKLNNIISVLNGNHIQYTNHRFRYIVKLRHLDQTLSHTLDKAINNLRDDFVENKQL